MDMDTHGNDSTATTDFCPMIMVVSLLVNNTNYKHAYISENIYTYINIYANLFMYMHLC